MIATTTRLSVITLCILPFTYAANPAAAEPSDTVTDDFERSSLGSNWNVLKGAPAIINSSDLGVLNSTGATLYWVGSSFSPDQYSEAVSSLDAPEVIIQVFVRRRDSDVQRYAFMWQNRAQICLDGTTLSASGGYILKRDGSVGAPYLTCLDAPRWNAGDSFRIEAKGNLLRGLVNGVEVVSATDDVLSEGGGAGIATNTTLTPLDPSQYPASIVETWYAGSFEELSGFDPPVEVPAPSKLLEQVVALGVIAGLYARCGGGRCASP